LTQPDPITLITVFSFPLKIDLLYEVVTAKKQLFGLQIFFLHENLEVRKVVMKFVLLHHQKFPYIEIFHILIYLNSSDTNENFRVFIINRLKKQH
jgi:hypothetical protein